MIISNVPSLQDINNSRAREHAGEIMAFTLHITSFNPLPPAEDSEPKQPDTQADVFPKAVAIKHLAL